MNGKGMHGLNVSKHYKHVASHRVHMLRSKRTVIRIKEEERTREKANRWKRRCSGSRGKRSTKGKGTHCLRVETRSKQVVSLGVHRRKGSKSKGGEGKDQTKEERREEYNVLRSFCSSA